MSFTCQVENAALGEAVALALPLCGPDVGSAGAQGHVLSPSLAGAFLVG